MIVTIAVAVVAGFVAMDRRHRRLRRRLAEVTSELRATAARTDRIERRAYGQFGLAARASAQAESAGGHTQQPGRLPMQLQSQFGEDAFLMDLFDGRTEGFFIEAGAFDGRRLSATYVLEALGWTGLLVEPMPDRFEQCRAARPGSRVVRVMVVEDLTESGDRRTRELLEQAGYECAVVIGHNGVWVDLRESDLRARARMLAKGGAVREGE